MKKNLQTLLIAMLLITASATQAQVRYLDEVFPTVQVDTSITYAQNLEFFTGFTALAPLVMDVYHPAGDTAKNRPIILLSHNGSFLPENLTHALVGLCFNGRKDSSIVELCQRFAKRGYVAVSFDYRLGWSATSADQITRTKTIIQAVYRAMQDAKSCIRYFKNDYANNNNSYGIDTGKIILGGSNSGAYVALAASAFNDTNEFNNIKFIDINGSFVKQDTIGDFDGFGGVQNHDNYPGISSRFECVLSLGGAVGDTSWIQPGETPILAFHGVNETGTQFNTGIVTTSTGQPVIEVSGPGDFMPFVDAAGNNDGFKPNNFGQGPPNRDGLGTITTPIEGLYPFYGQKFEPWNWFDTACYNGSAPMLSITGGNASPTKGNRYIDTIMGYSLPRFVKLFNLDTVTILPTGINNVTNNNEFSLFPNPANNELNISVAATQRPISNIRIFDVTGRMTKEITKVNSFTQKIDVSEMNSGIYLVSLQLIDGTLITRKLAMEK
ncbi:MAG: T9SS type A sorting domain-containing protein [Bacteroidetes bacterium]|nr:T9SS type A sorting domain-containing protein [Bacteroidota bacterium]